MSDARAGTDDDLYVRSSVTAAATGFMVGKAGDGRLAAETCQEQDAMRMGHYWLHASTLYNVRAYRI